MKIYELPETAEIKYYAACSSESVNKLFFFPGTWWRTFEYIACFDSDGDWITEFQVCEEDDGTLYMETEF